MATVFNATLNNISIISWQSVLLVKETRVPRENHQPAASHWHWNLKTRDTALLKFISHWILLCWSQRDQRFHFKISKNIGINLTKNYYEGIIYNSRYPKKQFIW